MFFNVDIYNNKTSTVPVISFSISFINPFLSCIKCNWCFVATGFGDAVNNTGCWLPVTEYIENQFDQFLEAEQRVHRYTLSGLFWERGRWRVAGSYYCLCWLGKGWVGQWQMSGGVREYQIFIKARLSFLRSYDIVPRPSAYPPPSRQ